MDTTALTGVGVVAAMARGGYTDTGILRSKYTHTNSAGKAVYDIVFRDTETGDENGEAEGQVFIAPDGTGDF
jgi:hypothetical protein